MAFLLEIILGIGIFATIWLLACGIFTITRLSVLESKNHLLATNLARRIMEQTISQPYPVPPIGETLWTSHSSRGGQEVTEDFIYSVEVRELRPPDELQSVLVRVQWTHSEARKEVTLQCYKAP
jgi:hypothetical protein